MCRLNQSTRTDTGEQRQEPLVFQAGIHVTSAEDPVFHRGYEAVFKFGNRGCVPPGCFESHCAMISDSDGVQLGLLGATGQIVDAHAG